MFYGNIHSEKGCENLNLTFEKAIVFLPLLTALTTFFLTSLFTLYRESKNKNHVNRIFFEYTEFELNYPIDNDPKHGEGRILLGDNGKELHRHAEKYGGAVYSFLILKNITENNAVNVKVKHEMSNRVGKNKKTASTKIVKEEFFMPIWKWKDTLYIPATFYDGDSNFSTNEELIITYSTTTFEKFKYSFVRQDDGSYKEKLKKRYLGFIWITKVNYQKSGFYSFINVRKENKEEE